MNHERILKIADVIEAHPEHFDMNTFMEISDRHTKESPMAGCLGPSHTEDLIAADIHACGTTACIAGWACWLWAAEVDTNLSIDYNAAQILGLSTYRAESLFAAFDLTTAAEAAAHLREMVAEEQDQ